MKHSTFAMIALWSIPLSVTCIGAFGNGEESITDDLQLGEVSQFYTSEYLYPIYSSEYLYPEFLQWHPAKTGFGTGGYGDATKQQFNLNVCTPTTVDRSNCTEQYPFANQYEWRFVENIGWRKFTPYGAARKDWWDIKRTFGWPFDGYPGPHTF